MSEKDSQQLDRMLKFSKLIEQQTGKAVRPYRTDGYVNVFNRYGTEKDTSEQYDFVKDQIVPDETLSMLYEENGLFSKIIDAPAEEAIKHGFTVADLTDEKMIDFYQEATDELDTDEVFMTGIKWARLFGGAIAVMLINDGRGVDEPLDWKNIRSIDDIRVYERAVIQPDLNSMFNYDPSDPFGKRGSRLGMPEYYHVSSKYGNFTVHESRCLTFQNGVLPENASNSIYQLWGVPEYVRIKRALLDTELAHRSAPKMLDKSVQAIYKMKGLADVLSTEDGEAKVLRRLQAIDMARGMMNSITIDNDGEDYDFRTFQFSGVSDVVDCSCNLLSALTNIPQTILFGRSPAGMNSTGHSDLENWYSYIERIQKRMVKSNLRYLLSVIFQAGVATGEIDEVPKIKIEFKPLWTMSETEKASLEQQKAQTDLTKAQIVNTYVGMQVLDPSEVRKKLADSGDFDIETILDETDEDEDFMSIIEGMNQNEDPSEEYGAAVNTSEHQNNPGTEGSAPANAPAATKLPQDMSQEEKIRAAQADPDYQSKHPDMEPLSQDAIDDRADDPSNVSTNTQVDGKQFSVGVLVISDGKVLSGYRHNDFGYGLMCGPGGHIEPGETPEQTAIRETQEEFGIVPKDLVFIGFGPKEPETGLKPFLFLCTDYDGEIHSNDLEMTRLEFRTMEEIAQNANALFQPFADGIEVLQKQLGVPLIGTLRNDMRDTLADKSDMVLYEDSFMLKHQSRTKLSDTNTSKKQLDLSAQKDTITMGDNTDKTATDGGPGSGNHGHKGVPGQIGGSAPNEPKSKKTEKRKKTASQKTVKHPFSKDTIKSKNGVESGSKAKKDHDLGSNVSPAAQKAYDFARSQEQKITDSMRAVSESIGCYMEGLPFSVKTASSVLSKIERKKKSAKDRGIEITDEEIVDSMGDIVRYTEICNHDDIAEATKATIDRLEDDGITISKIENKWLDSNAYNGVHLDCVSKDGQKFELQIHSPESMDVKNKLHVLYEEARSVDTPPARKAELEDQMMEISKTLPRPKNIDSIQNT